MTINLPLSTALCIVGAFLAMNFRFNKQFRDNHKDLIEECENEQIRIIEFLEKKSSFEQAQFIECLIIILTEVHHQKQLNHALIGSYRDF